MEIKDPLAKQAFEVLRIVESFEASFDKDSMEDDHINRLVSSAQNLFVKTSVMIENHGWLISIQYAAVVREEGQSLLSASSGLKIYTNLNHDYISILRKEIEIFRSMFREWVTQFKTQRPTGEYEELDEWGLF